MTSPRHRFPALMLDVQLSTDTLVGRGASLSGYRTPGGRIEIWLPTPLGPVLLWANPDDIASLLFIPKAAR